MAARAKPQPKAAAKESAVARLVSRTPLAEWTAAGLGLALTLGVLGVSLWEAVAGTDGSPAFSLEAEAPAAAGGGFVVPVILRNDSNTTASAVEIRGVLERDGEVVETRQATFDYAPGKGEVRGGLVFQNDPGAFQLRLSVEGYQEP